MKGTLHSGPADYIEFVADNKKGKPTNYRANLSWLVSRWHCIFGQGCPGHFGTDDPNTHPDIGCCSIGFYTRGKKERNKITERVQELTPEDWDDDLRAVVEDKGWYKRVKSEDGVEWKSRRHDGACVFSNREGGSSGKPGCAFHALADRTGQSPLDTKPYVCWQMPMTFYFDEEMDGWVIDGWDADSWQGADDNGTHDSWMSWWCMDTPDAFNNDKFVYQYLEAEIRKSIGDAAYLVLVQEVEKRLVVNYIEPVPGAVRNNGRPLLPLLIGDRTPKNAT